MFYAQCETNLICLPLKVSANAYQSTPKIHENFRNHRYLLRRHPGRCNSLQVKSHDPSIRALHFSLLTRTLRPPRPVHLPLRLPLSPPLRLPPRPGVLVDSK